MDIIGLILIAALALLMMLWMIYVGERKYEISCFIIALSPFIASSFITQDTLEPTIGSFIRIILMTCVGLCGLIMFARGDSIQLGKQYKYLFFFLVIITASTVYSVDPKYTLIRSLTFVALFCFLLGLDYWLKTEGYFYKLINYLYLLVWIIMAVNLASIILFPARAWYWEAHSRLQGLWSHPNELGSFCMLAYPIILIKMQDQNYYNKIGAGLLLFLTIVLHYYTGSRTTIFAAFIGVSLWAVLKKKIALLVWFPVVIAVGMVSLLHFQPEIFHRDRGYVKDVTDLTGREDFWQGAYTLIVEKPLRGYGFGVEGSVWNDPRFNRPEITLWSGTAKTSLHNGFISVAIGVGLVFFVLWCIILLYPIKGAWKYSYTDAGIFVLMIAVMCLLNNFVENAINGGRSYADIMYWVSWVIAGNNRTLSLS